MFKNGQQRLVWTPTTISAFQDMKENFTSAPILHHLDPKILFIVDVDALVSVQFFLSNKVISKYTLVHSTLVNSILRNIITV